MQWGKKISDVILPPRALDRRFQEDSKKIRPELLKKALGI